MPKEYIIQCRYEWRSSNGTVWTNWFAYDTTRYPDSSIKAVLKDAQNVIKNIDKVSKLKHEYRAYDADVYEHEYLQLVEDAKIAEEEFKKIPRMKKPWK